VSLLPVRLRKEQPAARTTMDDSMDSTWFFWNLVHAKYLCRITREFPLPLWSLQTVSLLKYHVTEFHLSGFGS
jgi:hypothetical protein